MAIVDVKPGAEQRKARSSLSDKYYVCIRETVRFEVEGELSVLSVGDLLIVERGEWFEYSNTGPDAAELLLVHVPRFDPDREEFAVERERR